MKQFNSTSDLFIQKLRKEADGRALISMQDEFHRITLDLIGKVKYSSIVD